MLNSACIDGKANLNIIIIICIKISYANCLKKYSSLQKYNKFLTSKRIFRSASGLPLGQLWVYAYQKHPFKERIGRDQDRHFLYCSYIVLILITYCSYILDIRNVYEVYKNCSLKHHL